MDFFSDTLLQLTILQSIIPLLMAILFAQSGLDKVTDFRGNLEWMTGHFSKTILRNAVKPSLICIAVMELLAATLCLLGIAGLWFFGSQTIAFWALVLCTATLIQLFAGQRIAKDYTGAATIAMYVLMTVAGLFVLRM